MSFLVQNPNGIYVIFQYMPKLIKYEDLNHKEYTKWVYNDIDGIPISNQTAIKILGELKKLDKPIEI